MRIEDIISYFLVGLFGYMFLGKPLFDWKKRLSCKNKINGTFIKVSSNHRFGITKIWAEFEYHYNGKNYQGYTVDKLSRRQLKKLVPGETYPLYINSDHPNTCRCTKRIIMFEDLFLFFFGALMFLGAIIMLLNGLFSYFS